MIDEGMVALPGFEFPYRGRRRGWDASRIDIDYHR